MFVFRAVRAPLALACVLLATGCGEEDKDTGGDPDDSPVDTPHDTGGGADTGGEADTGDQTSPGDTGETSDTGGSVDADGDGWLATWAGGDDCDDTDATVHPGAEETCNGVDQDCDGGVDTTTRDVFSGWLGPRVADVETADNILLVDLDDDGLVDIVSSDGGELVWALNPGVPIIDGNTFMSTWAGVEVDPDAYVLETLAEDLDDDGDRDVAAILVDDETGTDALWVLENQGDGTLSSPLWIDAVPSANGSLRRGDLDGDGLAELAYEYTLWWNEGGFAFRADDIPGVSDVDAMPEILDDGRAALLAHQSSWVWEGSWIDVGSDGSCYNQTGIKGESNVSDFDGDGHLDLIAARHEMRMCLGDGTGYLEQTATYLDGDSDVQAHEIHDADGDGHVDVVLTTQHGDPGDLVLYRGATGDFEELVALALPTEKSHEADAVWRDMDGDGEADLMAWYEYTQQWFLYPSDGEGSFHGPWAEQFNSDCDPCEAHPADLDGDGYTDIAVLCQDGTRLWFSAGDRDPVAWHQNPLDDGGEDYSWRPWARTIDLDGDGDEEGLFRFTQGASHFAVIDYDPATDNASSTLVDGPRLDIPEGESVTWTGAESLDFDGDGDDEILLGPRIECSTQVYTGVLQVAGLNGDGWPWEWKDLSGDVDLSAALTFAPLGDVDGDGGEELAAVDIDGVSVLSYDGGVVEERYRSETAWAPEDESDDERKRIAAVDVDQDGAMDLLVGASSVSELRFLRSDGAGGFTFADSYEVPENMLNTFILSIGYQRDLKGLVGWAAGSCQCGLKTWRQDAWGDFQTLDVQCPYSAKHRFTAADIDGDGLDDLLTGSEDRVWVTWGTEGTATDDACE